MPRALAIRISTKSRQKAIGCRSRRTARVRETRRNTGARCVHLFRIEKSRSKGTGGTGLGLATAKSVIDDLSGHLSFSHTPDNRFRVTISLETTGQE